MTCPAASVEQEDNGTSWPTANTRVNWARANYRKLPPSEQLHKFLVMLMNLTALNDLLEEHPKGGQFFTREQKEEWKGWYETWRPTQAVGRPKMNS
jgi:hypothetical protein